MSVRLFGHHEGQQVFEIALRSEEGAEADIITYGAAVRDLRIPAAGSMQRVVNGLLTMEDYLSYSPHFGAIAGRFANRINGGRFELDGLKYELPLNQDNKHSLHGGPAGFSKQVWQLAAHDGASVTLTLVSPDGQANYPGTLVALCSYRLIGTVLQIELRATTDKATPINLCSHSYFNLDGSPTILDHELEVAADFYTPVDADLIPTGEIRHVGGTPLDFRQPRPVRLRDQQTASLFRYDHNYVLHRTEWQHSDPRELPLSFAARLASKRNGLMMEVWTTEPGLQVYDGVQTNLAVPGHDGVIYGSNSGLCLEPQHFPDSPNNSHFPETILRPTQVYRQRTEYRFRH